jgi:hypothetical protein
MYTRSSDRSEVLWTIPFGREVQWCMKKTLAPENRPCFKVLETRRIRFCRVLKGVKANLTIEAGISTPGEQQ